MEIDAIILTTIKKKQYQKKQKKLFRPTEHGLVLSTDRTAAHVKLKRLSHVLPTC